MFPEEKQAPRPDDFSFDDDVPIQQDEASDSTSEGDSNTSAEPVREIASSQTQTPDEVAQLRQQVSHYQTMMQQMMQNMLPSTQKAAEPAAQQEPANPFETFGEDELADCFNSPEKFKETMQRMVDYAEQRALARIQKENIVDRRAAEIYAEQRRAEETHNRFYGENPHLSEYKDICAHVAGQLEAQYPNATQEQILAATVDIMDKRFNIRKADSPSPSGGGNFANTGARRAPASKALSPQQARLNEIQNL